MRETNVFKFPQFEGNDQIRKEDFNGAFQKTEDALNDVNADIFSINSTLSSLVKNVGATGKNVRAVWGSYVGDGRSGAQNGYSTVIEVGFKPVLLIITAAEDNSNNVKKDIWVVVDTTYEFKIPTGYVPIDGIATATWGETSVAFRCDSYLVHDTGTNYYPQYQYNSSGTTYNWVCIGYDE